MFLAVAFTLEYQLIVARRGTGQLEVELLDFRCLPVEGIAGEAAIEAYHVYGWIL